MSLLSGLKFIPRDQIHEEEEDDSDAPIEKKKSRRRKEKHKTKSSSRYSGSSSSEEDAGKKGKRKVESNSTERTEAGLGWMLRPKESEERKPVIADDSKPVEPLAEEVVTANPRELNPYLKNSGSGYPEEDDKNSGGNKLLANSIVGDGGASWRLKALKRAQEQAAREGRRVDEIVGERWGSVSELAASKTSRVAPARAHLHAIHNRRRGNNEEFEIVSDKGYERNTEKHVQRDYLKDVSSHHPEMKAPKVRDSLSWGKRKSQDTSKPKSDVSTASPGDLSASRNAEMLLKKENDLHIRSSSRSSKASENRREENIQELDLSEQVGKVEEDKFVKPGLSSNQLAAKALQLRMKGRHKEAEELMKEAENIKAQHESVVAEPSRSHYEGSSSRYVMESKSANRKKDEDADRLLAQNIARNKQFSVHDQADDEYDFDDGPRRKSRKKGGTNDSKTNENTSFTRRILTQQERCQFCFENPKRPKHLVISVANFTYLMLPQSQPVVPGHCCILPMQHEASTRSVDNSVWEELRNFKKCLIMMFAEQEKDVVFLETVMGLAQQKRHCLIECIPLPQDIARDAPLYFKKAIDEAEDEWSQHNAKKLIDTSVKGLRGSIPKDFPYFHVEFGLNKGFVHVIDDETQFKSSFGLNVIRGMLELAEEDMYRKRRHESFEAQRNAVTSFVQDWDRFDWTKQL